MALDLIRLLTKLCFSIGSLFLLAAFGGSQVLTVPAPQKEPGTAPPLKLVATTDRERYSTRDTIEMDVALRNDGDTPVYIDRRMFWGRHGGLSLEIRDQQGKAVSPSIQDDAMMPPPPEGDASVLNRVDPGFFYGRRRKLHVRDYFSAPGTYTIHVQYKSWLRKEEVQTQLRSLSAIWGDSPAIDSNPISVVIAP